MNETSKAARIFEFLKYSALALLPVLDIYRGIEISGTPVLALGMAVLLALAVIEIFVNRGRFVINRHLLFIFLLLIAINIIDGFLHMGDIDISGTLNNTLYVIAASLISAYYVRTGIVEKERFLKFLIAVGLVATIFIFIQYILYLKGTVIYGFIPGLPLDKPIQYDWDVSISYGRPNSIFTEPAHYTIYILPIFAILLFRRRFILSAVFMAGILVSTSSTGLFISLVVLGIFIAKEKRIPIIIKWILAIIGVVLLIQFIPTLSKSSVIEKLKFVNLATNVRVFGTLESFRYYGVKELLLGTGLNRLAEYVKLTAGLDVDNYANTFFFVFFSFGFIGGSAFTAYIVRLHKLSRFKMVFLVLILVCFSDQLMINRNLIYLLLLLHVFADQGAEAIESGSAEKEGIQSHG